MNLVTAKTTVEGLHHWPDAPDRRAYLRHPHRHLFVVRSTVRVDHAERDVEFHDLADQVKGYVLAMGERFHPDALLVDFGPASCELIAATVGELLARDGYAVASVEVSEDDEQTAIWMSDVVL